jgi:nucleoside 2-deoxyribosyltransferase
MERDYPLGYCRNRQEFEYLLEYLRGQTLLSGEALTVPGWERVRELRVAGVESTQAFVAMSFHESLRPADTKGIRPAIEAAGYKPVVMFELEHVDRIDDRILVEISRSRFMVADFTDHRPGVYFEAGYALGQRKTVIWTCRKDDREGVHFDIRQYNRIEWGDPEELRDRLYNRISALLI